jgi:hypothetical protein
MCQDLYLEWEDVVVYVSATWSLTLREEYKLRMFENMLLRRIFGSKRVNVKRGWRNELYNSYSSPNIINMIKSRSMR